MKTLERASPFCSATVLVAMNLAGLPCRMQVFYREGWQTQHMPMLAKGDCVADATQHMPMLAKGVCATTP